MDTNEAKDYAESLLAKFIGSDFNDESVQISFCHTFGTILDHFFNQGLVVVNENFYDRPVIGCTFEDVVDPTKMPMLIHQM